MTDLDYGRFEALTFDCYGTLIDWEAGIVGGPAAGAGATRRRGLRRRAARGRSPVVEAAAEAGPYPRYRDILGRCLRGVAARYGVRSRTRRGRRLRRFGRRLAGVPGLGRGALRGSTSASGSGVITNCDDDLFARSATRLGTTFDWVVTAQQAGALQARRAPLRARLRADRPAARPHPPRRPEPVPRPRPGASGWACRRSGSTAAHGRPGFGATPPAEATPDATFPDMASFAAAATAG